MIARPYPPAELVKEDARPSFVPSVELAEWAHGSFLDPESAIYNPDHHHLPGGEAGIVWVWTNVEGRARGRSTIGEARLLQHGQSRWDKALLSCVLTDWYRAVRGDSESAEEEPDFAITLYAPWCATASDAEFMALVEHELYHCAQKVNAYGFPCVSQTTGRPVWTIKGHDVECHIGEVRRYGTVSPDIAALVEAAKKPPLVSSVYIAAACGTCRAA